MRAITLWQPWASLIAEGVKTIETRPKRSPWSSAVGETIAIHAATKWPDQHHYFPPLCPAGCWRDEEKCPGHIAVIPTITDPVHQRPHIDGRGPSGRRRDPVPKASQTPTIFWPKRGVHARPAKENGYGQTSYAPLGAVVATCTVVEVIPIVSDIFEYASQGRHRCVFSGPGADGKLVLSTPGERGQGNADHHIIEDQRPFGDYAAGRWALLLDDIVKLREPFPCTGHQGLWRVDPNVEAAITSVSSLS